MSSTTFEFNVHFAASAHMKTCVWERLSGMCTCTRHHILFPVSVPDDLSPEEQQELESIRRRKQELLQDIQVSTKTHMYCHDFCLFFKCAAWKETVKKVDKCRNKSPLIFGIYSPHMVYAVLPSISLKVFLPSALHQCVDSTSRVCSRDVILCVGVHVDLHINIH